VDGSFHSPEWHAARLASLNKSHTVTWEEFKKKQKVICGYATFFHNCLAVCATISCAHTCLYNDLIFLDSI
jgi:hypothetical protein